MLEILWLGRVVPARVGEPQKQLLRLLRMLHQSRKLNKSIKIKLKGVIIMKTSEIEGRINFQKGDFTLEIDGDVVRLFRDNTRLDGLKSVYIYNLYDLVKIVNFIWEVNASQTMKDSRMMVAVFNHRSGRNGKLHWVYRDAQFLENNSPISEWLEDRHVQEPERVKLSTLSEHIAESERLMAKYA